MHALFDKNPLPKTCFIHILLFNYNLPTIIYEFQHFKQTFINVTTLSQPLHFINTLGIEFLQLLKALVIFHKTCHGSDRKRLMNIIRSR